MAIYPNLRAFGNALSLISSAGEMNSKALSELSNVFSQLNTKQIVSVAMSKEMGKADLFSALQKAGLTREQRKNIAAQIEAVGATGATTAVIKKQTAANKANSLSLGGIKDAFKGLGHTIKDFISANKVLLAITAAIAVGYGLYKLITHVSAALERQREIVSKLKNEISALEGEEKLLDSKGDERTKAEERRLELLRAQLVVKQKQLEIDTRLLANNQFTGNSYIATEGGGVVEMQGGLNQAYSDVERYKKAKKELEAYNAEIEKYSDTTGMSEVARAF